jgi:hypothetical protein
MLSVEAPSRQTVAEPLNVPVGVISTIFIDPDVLNGVADGGAGLVIGATVTAVGVVPPKLKVIAGSAAVAGISAVLTFATNVATCELATGPAAITAAGAVNTAVTLKLAATFKSLRGFAVEPSLQRTKLDPSFGTAVTEEPEAPGKICWHTPCEFEQISLKVSTPAELTRSTLPHFWAR